MKQTVYKSDFIDAFEAIRPDNFSYHGLCVLFEMLTDCEEACGDELELDVIAICCDYSESTIDEFFDDYEGCLSDYDDERDTIEEYLNENAGDYRWVNIPDSGWHILYADF